jgi:hypothetical protein
MKHQVLYTSTVFLGALIVLMLIGVVTGKGQTTDNPAPVTADAFVKQFCFEGKIDSMDIKDLSNAYTKATNAYFNERIKEIMTNPKETVPTPDLNDYSAKGGALCKSATGEKNDMTCQSIAVCNPNQSASDPSPKDHPYCLAVTLLGVPPSKITNYNWERLQTIKPLRYSYFCYKAALDMKRDSMFDGTPQGILAKCPQQNQTNEYANQTICKLNSQLAAEQDPVKRASLEKDLAAELDQTQWWSTSLKGAVTSMTATLIDVGDSTAKRIQFIDEEIVRAKTALDQTLDAYSQMKTAWQMHVRYMDIFAELVQYRDHLVEIRKQTDAFPFRFIDATSTKCL